MWIHGKSCWPTGAEQKPSNAMVIRESSAPFLELELSGTAMELCRIAERLATMTAGQSLEISADLVAGAPPYQRCLNRLVVKAVDGPVRVEVAADVMVVSGSPELLAIFASYLQFADGAESG